MKLKSLLNRILIISVVVFFVILSISIVWNPKTAHKNESTYTLRVPEFVTAAHASSPSLPAELVAQLDEEAGISAYTQTADPVNLTTARAAFRTIEADTASYIIGSVAITSYPEHFDVHVFIHTDGWVMAYYLRQDPVAKMVDGKSGDITITHLQTALTQVATSAGILVGDIHYYDFRYPNATNILIVGEDSSNGADFQITLPSSFAYYERSYIVTHGQYQNISVDGVDNPGQIYDSSWNAAYGTLSASQLSPDTAHVVSFSSFDLGAVVIVYRVP